MDFTNEQNNALKAKGRVLVSAAAGSGKTAVLVEKCVRMICDEKNPVSVDKIIVATFTVAAASEMKTRILKELNKKIKNNPENVYLRKQKLLLPSAKIGTIDSLCISLAREYFYKLNISPDFKIADESVLNKIKNSVADELINRHLKENDLEFKNLVAIFGNERGCDLLKENIFSLYDYLSALAFPDEFCKRAIEIYQNFGKKSRVLDYAYDYYSDLFVNKFSIIKQSIKDMQQDALLAEKYGPAFEEVAAKIKKVLDLINAKNYDGIYQFLEYYSNAPLQSARVEDKAFRDRIKKTKDDAEKAFQELKKFFNSDMEYLKLENYFTQPHVEKFISLTKEFSDAFYQEKQQKNCFSFADIEFLILNLLVKKKNGKKVYTDTAKELSQRYYTILADEYQDTNDLQNTIFEAISNGGKNLFMVGDVKQSIYGFRNANPKNFLKFRDELPAFEENSESSKVIMSGNFRSSDDVCDFVNALFYSLFSKKCGGLNYLDDDKLVQKAQFCEVNSPRVSLDLVEKSCDDYSLIEHQIYHIAKIIKEKVEGEPCISDEDSKTLRKAEYKDFCVLLRSRTHLKKFETVFKSLSIPVWVDDNEGLLLQPEIINIFAFLQVIDNPFADIPLITLMLSDIYGFSADEVAQIRAENKKIEFYRALLAAGQKSEKLENFLNEIEEFRRLSINCSVSDLINKILIKTGYENTVFSYENGEEAYNNLILFKNIANNFEANNSNGLNAFVNYINYQKNNNGGFNKSSDSGENDNVVKIMTIHRSKGLQFPVCIVANLDKRFNHDHLKSDLIISDKIGIGLKYIDSDSRAKIPSIIKKIANIEKTNSNISEELRVLYVALTRAKDFLYMVGYKEDSQKSLDSIISNVTWDTHNKINPYYVQNCTCFLDMIIPVAFLHPDGRELRNNCTYNVTPFDFKGKLQTRIIKDVNFEVEQVKAEQEEKAFDENLYQKIAKNLEFSYKYKDLNKIFVKQSASALAHKEFSADYDYSTEPVFLRNQRLSAADKGTAMHKFMQFCDFATAKNDILAETKRLVKQGKLTADEEKSLKIDSLKAFLNSPLCEKVIKSEAVFKEQGFMVEIPANEIYDDLSEQFEGENVIIQGFCDLCFADGNGIFIVDYKTDRANQEELVKRYKKQLDIYEKALKLTFNKEITGKAIYSFYLNKVIML